MRQRLRGPSAHTKNPSIRWGRFLLNVLWLLAVLALLLIGVLKHSGAPVVLNQAFSLGVQRATFQHLTPGPVAEWIVLALVLASIRWIALEFRAVRGAGIEVRPVDNASGHKVDTHPLDVAFREYMTLPKLYQLTTIPGDPEPEHLVEVLKVPSSAGWRGLMAGAFSYAFPRRAFIVSASLRTQPHKPMYGVAVQVRRLPGLATELGTQWSTSFERALQRGAYAAVAYILPQTRACKKVPWSAWRRYVIPPSLFRDYQRAKKMVSERRYDEALELYHQALIKDANNIDIRYDIGQLYERLGLYPDALHTYLSLIDQLFPNRSRAWLIRIIRPTRRGKRDAFVIWYRYVIVLALGSSLARELLHPDWEELRKWLAHPDRPDSDQQYEERPIRTVEFIEIRRLLIARLDKIYCGTNAPESKISLAHWLDDPCSDEALKRRTAVLERCLLRCAESEARMLARSMKWSVQRYVTLRKSTSLTLTAVRQAQATIKYRLDLLNGDPGATSAPDGKWSLNEIETQLTKAGYKASRSTNWLEHYNAACNYALVMRGDEVEHEQHLPYAYAAISALELALRYGEDIDFLRTKQYWLQAGDPDLAGLRRYACFRAFETRVYGRPLPATVHIAKYELYLYLRAVVEDSAGHLEEAWRKRSSFCQAKLTHAVFEEWWRQERHAWELAIRLGRFYPQWQTRRDAVESYRNWSESSARKCNPCRTQMLTGTPMRQI